MGLKKMAQFFSGWWRFGFCRSRRGSRESRAGNYGAGQPNSFFLCGLISFPLSVYLHLLELCLHVSDSDLLANVFSKRG